MQRSNDEWLSALDHDDAAAKDLVAFLRKSLGRSFGHQLDDARIEDLAQSALVRVLEKRDTFAGDSRFTTWAVAIAVNLALSELRRKRHQDVSLDQAVARGKDWSVAPREEVPLQRAQANAALKQAIDTVLTPRQREALYAELGGFPLAEVAERMGSSRGALYKLLHDARKKLRTHLEAQGHTAQTLLEVSS